MCGIIGAFHTGENKTPVNDIVLNQFEDQKERGVNGFGIVKINDKMEYKVDRATEGFKFMWDIHQDPVRGMLAHHRIPTSSENKLNQTHPFLVDNGSLKYKYLLVHNGVIHNDKELKKEHEDLGFIYTTQDKEKFNDSECVAIEVARFIEKQVDKVGTKGSAAFVCLQINKKTEKVNHVFFGRNEGNPLNMAKTRNKMLISSTGQGVEVAPFKLYGCKLDDKMELFKRKMEFATDPPIQYTKPSYPIDVKTNKWDNWDNDDYFDHCKKGYYKSTNKEIAEEEQTDIENAIEISADFIQGDISGFFDLLYSESSIEYVDEKDIETVTESIRIELTRLLKEVQELNIERQLELDAEKELTPVINQIGFTD